MSAGAIALAGAMALTMSAGAIAFAGAMALTMSAGAIAFAVAVAVGAFICDGLACQLGCCHDTRHGYQAGRYDFVGPTLMNDGCLPVTRSVIF
jgi:hypothetical protein